MIGFAKFINETTSNTSSENKNIADGFVKMYNRAEEKDYTYTETQVFNNEFGKQEGYLYIDKASNAAIRPNFKGNNMTSVSNWKTGYNAKMPTSTVRLKNPAKGTRQGILSCFDDFKYALQFEGDESVRVYTPDGTYGYALSTGIYKMYKKGYSLDAILWWFQDAEIDEEDVYRTLKYEFDVYRPKFGDKRFSNQEMEEIEENGERPDEFPENTYDTENVEVLGAVPETDEENPYAVKNDEELAAQLIADPLPVFEQLNTYVLMVARGLNNALLITGQGGVGKSYNVNKILEAYGQKNKDFVIMKGKSSISAMYKFLYDNYNKIVVFDDCDSVLQSSDGLNILKGVLDSGRIREVSWNTSGPQMVNTFGCETHEEIEKKLAEWSEVHKGREGIPNYFQFEGACIFISNLMAEDMMKNPAMAPLLTRCTYVDIDLMAHDVIYRMESILPHMKIYDRSGKDISDPEIKKEVFDYISSPEFLEDPRVKGKKLSMRLYQRIYSFKYAGLPKWKELAFCL